MGCEELGSGTFTCLPLASLWKPLVCGMLVRWSLPFLAWPILVIQSSFHSIDVTWITVQKFCAKTLIYWITILLNFHHQPAKHFFGCWMCKTRTINRNLVSDWQAHTVRVRKSSAWGNSSPVTKARGSPGLRVIELPQWICRRDFSQRLSWPSAQVFHGLRNISRTFPFGHLAIVVNI